MKKTPAIKLRYPRLKDAERLYEILQNPKFIYFPVKIDSVESELLWIKATKTKRKKNLDWGYSILYDGKLVGAIGITIDQHPHRQHIGELGYFIDEHYWNKNIATQAVALVEEIGFTKLGLKRIEIRMVSLNKSSEKVAIKNGYTKEGLLKKSHIDKRGRFKDTYIYAKVA